MIDRLRAQINDHFVGKEAVVENVLICLLAGGHILLEDVPGVGKTTLARTLSRSVGADFGRIQFTPDTLPSDVTGISIYDVKTGEFTYREGGIMHNFILADEINRTSPKTQSSLLEAMAEGQVTVDGEVHRLPELFMVIATQNPLGFMGTYPLPEAELDRFMMRLSIGYPEPEAELKLTRNALIGKGEKTMSPVCSIQDVLAAREQADGTYLSDGVLDYIREIAAVTRREPRFAMGVSPRATIFLAKASKAAAFLAGRDFVKPDDVKAVAVNTLHHRVLLTSEAKLRREDPDAIIRDLMLHVKVPME